MRKEWLGSDSSRFELHPNCWAETQVLRTEWRISIWISLKMTTERELCADMRWEMHGRERRAKTSWRPQTDSEWTVQWGGLPSSLIISLKELGFVCISLICGRFGGLTRSYLAYIWQSHLQPFIMVRACRHDHNASDRQSSGNPISVAGISG